VEERGNRLKVLIAWASTVGLTACAVSPEEQGWPKERDRIKRSEGRGDGVETIAKGWAEPAYEPRGTRLSNNQDQWRF
jgi:hypothetical protein